MKKIFKYILLLLISGCYGDNTTTGNPVVSLSVEGTRPDSLSSNALALNSNPVTIEIRDTLDSVVGSLTITEVKAALRDIELVTETLDGDEEGFDFPGPFIVDLLSNTTTPSFSMIELSAGLYTEVFVTLDKIEGDEVDENGNPLLNPGDSLFGNSIALVGSYTGPTSTGQVTDMPFTLTYDLNEELQLTGAGDESVGFNLSTEALNPIILAFRMNKWFQFDDTFTNPDGLEPSDLVVESGEITLTENSTGTNFEIRELLQENIVESIDYGRDLDLDGELDIDEDDDPDDEDEDDD